MKNKIQSPLSKSLFIIIILISLASSMLVFYDNPLRVDIIPVKFIIGDRLGFDVNSSELNYGIILKGNSGVRKLIVENNYPYSVYVNIYVSKNIQPYLYTEENIIVKENEIIKIPIILRVPNDIEYGNYSGEIKVEFKKADQ